MKWRDHAACDGADPEMFAPLDHHGRDEWTAIELAANSYCAGCPSMQACGEFADQARHLGTWAGVYRWRKQGTYQWRVIATGAQAPQLTDRRTGVNTGWNVA